MTRPWGMNEEVSGERIVQIDTKIKLLHFVRDINSHCGSTGGSEFGGSLATDELWV